MNKSVVFPQLLLPTINPRILFGSSGLFQNCYYSTHSYLLLPYSSMLPIGIQDLNAFVYPFHFTYISFCPLLFVLFLRTFSMRNTVWIFVIHAHKMILLLLHQFWTHTFLSWRAGPMNSVPYVRACVRDFKFSGLAHITFFYFLHDVRGP